jgi:N-dimethylarginine dimethylaminohydrolase
LYQQIAKSAQRHAPLVIQCALWHNRRTLKARRRDDTRPGTDSRRPETVSIVRALEPYRRLVYIQAPGTVDGGDVLRLGKTLFVGLSSRSNASALEQMQNALRPYGYTVQGVPVTGCLHLKSAVTQVADDTLLINPNWVDARDWKRTASE